METKERVSLLIQLADYSARRYDRRASSELQMSFAVWAVMLTPYVLDDAPQLPIRVHPLTGALVVTLIYVALWLKPLWTANCSDKSMADFYRRAAHSELMDERKTDALFPARLRYAQGWGLFGRDWSMLFQTAVTFMCSLLGVAGTS